jgi:DNA-binding transcriptional regulator PaaX
MIRHADLMLWERAVRTCAVDRRLMPYSARLLLVLLEEGSILSDELARVIGIEPESLGGRESQIRRALADFRGRGWLKPGKRGTRSRLELTGAGQLAAVTLHRQVVEQAKRLEEQRVAGVEAAA